MLRPSFFFANHVGSLLMKSVLSAFFKHEWTSCISSRPLEMESIHFVVSTVLRELRTNACCVGRVQDLVRAAAGLAQFPDLELMLTRLAEPLMVQLVQNLLQLQALPVLLLELDNAPAILDVIFWNSNAR